MKKAILSLSALLAIFLISGHLTAQSSFGNFETLNRVIMINYADDADQEVKKEVLTLFKGMRKKIEGVEWVHIADLSNSSQGFEQAITLTFKSKAGLEEYEEHPDHLRIKKISEEIVEDLATYEFWEKM